MLSPKKEANLNKNNTIKSVKPIKGTTPILKKTMTKTNPINTLASTNLNYKVNLLQTFIYSIKILFNYIY